jgi:hypothetical protein
MPNAKAIFIQGYKIKRKPKANGTERIVAFQISHCSII